ncbi:hypothetical protein CC80DRAFT_561506 [Byssothecium circinans]|uniref:LysR family regulatory protein n=1 Tax=Byssothecium circinans TaxID=147558 RepID=A0A6A5U1Z9_9PLEO|nr:hypothetical protein CC80DRAFT_561506 [Byssothecium circinans]
MFNLLSLKPTPLPTDGTKTADRVVPLHFFDDSPLWRSIILYSLFVFDDILEPEKLHSSLERLIRKEGWWKLGARLRQNKTGALEYHIPSIFTEERPALAYSRVVHNTTVAEHPLASRLPRASTKPAIVGNPDEFLDFIRPEGRPMKLGDYLNTDRPQLGLHIVSFRDATLVSLYWPHTLFDAMGKKALLDAWSLVLQGMEDEVAAPHGSDVDPLVTLGTNITEYHKLNTHRMGILGLIGYGLGQLGSFVRKKENRIVCVPFAFVQALRERVVADLASQEPTGAARIDEKGMQHPFLSEGDVLVAWWTRLVIAHLPPRSSQTVVLNHAYCLRATLTPDLIPSNAPYVSNAVGFIPVMLRVSDILQNPTAYVASSVRDAIVDLGNRPQVEAFSALIRESSAKMPPFFGNSNMHMITYSNWTKAKLFQVNFAAAVVQRDGVQTDKLHSGRPRYIQNNQFGLKLPNGFPIIGKDNYGNYWLSGYMMKGHWDHIEELLAKAT